VAGLDPEDIASRLDDLFTLLPQPARRAKIIRFDQHVDSATINPIIGA
jgi:hypothetical protein